MNLTIKALEPSMASVFTDYFERLQFDHSPSWASCFCRFYHMDCPFEEWKDRTGEMNKAASHAAIESEAMKGFLAFEGDQCVGWLNANKASAYLRLLEELTAFDKERWGLTICYVIDPEHRGKGVATALLDHAVSTYREMGFDGMLAVPLSDAGSPEKHYRGKVSTYKKAGYEVVEEVDGVVVMKLDFK